MFVNCVDDIWTYLSHLCIMIVGMIVTNDAMWKSDVLKEYDIELGFK